MKHSKPHKYYGRWLPQSTGTLVFAGFAGTLFALSEILENDTDNDGWTDAEEIIAGTNPADETDPWDSDGDGIADYLEFLDGTDPLDPFDPPQTRSVASVMNAVAPTDDEAENTSDSTTNILSLPAPTWSSQQNMWHNTAWFGQVLNYTFYTPSESSAWKAYAGTEIEYWGPDYYELSARNGSYGIVITLENAPVGSYTLKWNHLQRPDGGTTNYSVSVRGSATATANFTAPSPSSVDSARLVSLTFLVTSSGPIQISFIPTITDETKGPLVGSIEMTFLEYYLKLNCLALSPEEQRTESAAWRKVGVCEQFYIELWGKDGCVEAPGVSISVDDRVFDSASTDLLEAPSSVDSSVLIPVQAYFPDGRILEQEIEVVEPSSIRIVSTHKETNRISTENGTLAGELIEYTLEVLPLSVSFSNVYVWETVGTSTTLGMAERLTSEQKTHSPNPPILLSEENQFFDLAGVKVLFGLPIEKNDWNNQSVGKNLGTLVWNIPAYWKASLDPLDRGDEALEGRESDGTFGINLQSFNFVVDSSSKSESLGGGATGILIKTEKHF